jgi:hypothetical protein
MLFFAEKNNSLYVCQSSWDDASTVMRVPVGLAGHVEGEQYETKYNPRQMQVLATRAEMIDLDREINVQGVAYRLDLQNLRIKHLAQAAKSTATTSGKAHKGMLSWQTYRKFEILGDLAYAWYELIGQSPDWRKMQCEPYVAPHDLDGVLQIPGDPATRPDDADPGIQESGATLEGEVLPPAADTPEVLPALPPAVAGRVASINALHDEIEEYLAGFAERVVRCGLELLALKKEVGHGKFLKFFEQNLSRQRFQIRHAQNYMAVAQAVKAKIAGQEGGMALLLNGEESGDGGEAQFTAIRETLADMTDARSWQQLWMDFGLMRSPQQRGGDHGGGAASHERSMNRHQIELELAIDEWRLIIKQFRDFAIARNRSQLVPGPMLEEGMKSIKDCMRQVEQVIQKG